MSDRRYNIIDLPMRSATARLVESAIPPSEPDDR